MKRGFHIVYQRAGFAEETASGCCRPFLFFLLLLSVVSRAAFAASDDDIPQKALEIVKLQLRWKHQFQFAGYYAALEKGFYREAGLDVRLREGEPGKEPIDEVLAGRAEYCTANSEALQARLQGKPLVALAAIFQHSPLVLLALADSGIRTPHDLVGRRVMLARGRHDTEFLAMFLREGIRPENLDIVFSTARIDDLIAGRIDAINAYLSNEPFLFRQLGVDVVAINPGNYGIDYYGDVLVTSEAEIEANPERARAMREASLKGWRYAMDHPDEIIDLLLGTYRVPKSREHLEFEARAVRSLILPDLVEIGHMNPGRWRGVAEVLKTSGMVDGDARLEGFIYDPEPHIWQARMRQTVMSLGGVIAAILLVILYMCVTQRRLRREIALRREVEDRLRSVNDLLQRTGRLAKVGGFEKNIVNNTTILTEEAARIRGAIPGVEIPADEIMAYYSPEERPFRLAENERAIRDGIPWEHESLLTMPSGKQAWIYSRGEALFRDGKVVKLVGAMQDITDRKLVELALMRRTRELEMHNSILGQLHEGVAFADVLDSLAAQTGKLRPGMRCAVLLLDAASGRLHAVAAPGLPESFVAGIEALPADDETCPSNRALKSGRRVVVEGGAGDGCAACWAQPIKGREKRVLGVFDAHWEASAAPGEDDVRLLENCANLAAVVIEHHLSEEKIRNLAYFDVLTQLPNRRMLVDRLRQAMANGRRSGCRGALMFLDLDNFKPLNDTFGHHVGDLLLIQVAQRIVGCVRETDTVARFGGDEFVIMLAELDVDRNASEVLARGVAEKIRSILAEPFVLTIGRKGGEPAVIEHRCTASIGVVLFFDHEYALDDIIRWSDEAMYQAKEAGRNRIHFRE